jgi:hypothetical protein
VTRALVRALDLFDPDLSVSDGEAALSVPPQKRPRKSALPKNVLKPSTAKGNFK